jgi:hypothetical protein
MYGRKRHNIPGGSSGTGGSGLLILIPPQSFPKHLQEHIAAQIPEHLNIKIQSSLYPTYKSVKPISHATKNLLEWCVYWWFNSSFNLNIVEFTGSLHNPRVQ